MTVHDLIEKTENFESLPQKEQIKKIAYFYCLVNNTEEFSTKLISDEFKNQKLQVPKGISSLIPNLTKTKPISFIKTKNGYTLHRTQKKDLDRIYIEPHETEVSFKLRELLTKVKSKEQKIFLEEAIKCFEIKCYRASIIMTWLLTIDVLYELILESKNLVVFNAGIQNHGKYKKIVITKKDDFSDIKETDFIELLRVAKLVSNDIRKILDEKLGFRNSCAHPNTIFVDELKSTSFIKDLVINIIEKFQCNSEETKNS